MDTERILVAPRAELFAARHLQGFSADPAAIAHFLGAVVRCGGWVERRPAEEDDGLKQIVPYGVVLHGERVYLFQRGRRGVEAGLRVSEDNQQRERRGWQVEGSRLSMNGPCPEQEGSCSCEDQRHTVGRCKSHDPGSARPGLRTVRAQRWRHPPRFNAEILVER